MQNVIKIVKIKYPVEYYDVFLLFDQSSGHTAFAEDALNANKMNVKPGGGSAKNARHHMGRKGPKDGLS